MTSFIFHLLKKLHILMERKKTALEKCVKN